MLIRRNYGRNHGYFTVEPGLDPADKASRVKRPGVTAILGMMPKDNLIGYASRVTARHAVDHWDELAALPVSERLERLEKARYEELSAAGLKGTNVHAVAEQEAAGLTVPYPAELHGYVESYRRFLADFDVDPIAIELAVCNRAVGYCGTADLVAHLPAVTYHGTAIPAAVWLLELKTSRSGIWRESALQACGYQHAETYAIPPDTDEHPLSDLGITRAGSVWIRADGYDLKPLDTGPDVWAYFCRLAANYHAEDDTKEWVGAAIMPPGRSLRPRSQGNGPVVLTTRAGAGATRTRETEATA